MHLLKCNVYLWICKIHIYFKQIKVAERRCERVYVTSRTKVYKLTKIKDGKKIAFCEGH